MLFENIAGVTQEHLDRAMEAVGQEEKNGASVAEFIAELPFWQQHLDRIHTDKREEALEQVMIKMDTLGTGATSDSSQSYLAEMESLQAEYNRVLHAFYADMTRQYLGVAAAGNTRQAENNGAASSGLSATRLATISSLDAEQRRIFLERLDIDPDHEQIDPSTRIELRNEIFEFLRPELPALGNFPQLYNLVVRHPTQQVRAALLAAGMQLPHEQPDAGDS